MSTNASINVLCDDGNYRSIYLHWDGYPSHALETLKRSYNTSKKAEELVAMGDCSSLEDVLDESTFYARDRDEDWDDVQPCVAESSKECLRHNNQQYNYLFDGNNWTTV